MAAANDRWITELKEIQRKIQFIKNDLNQQTTWVHKNLIFKKNKLDKAQEKLSELFGVFQAPTQPSGPISIQQQSIAHWSNRLAEQVGSYFENYCQFLNDWMWLRIIQAQLETGEDEAIQDIDVVKMSNRLESLNKSEKILQKAIKDTNREKQKLKERYEALETRNSNQEAASTMQASWQKEKQKLQATDNYIRWLTLPLRGTTLLEKKRNNMQAMLESKCHIAMQFCRDLLAKNGDVRVALGDEAMQNIETNLNKIIDLKQEIEVMNEQIVGETANTPPPIVLKKNPFTYKQLKHD